MIGISFCVKNCKEKVFQKRCVRNSFRSFFFEVGKLGPEEEVVPTTVVKTKHGLSIKVAGKKKLQDCVFLLFFLKQKFLGFFLCLFIFFFLTVRPHQLALSAQTLFFFSFYSLKQKKQQQLFFFLFLPSICRSTKLYFSL